MWWTSRRHWWWIVLAFVVYHICTRPQRPDWHKIWHQCSQFTNAESSNSWFIRTKSSFLFHLKYFTKSSKYKLENPQKLSQWNPVQRLFVNTKTERRLQASSWQSARAASWTLTSHEESKVPLAPVLNTKVTAHLIRSLTFLSHSEPVIQVYLTGLKPPLGDGHRV